MGVPLHPLVSDKPSPANRWNLLARPSFLVVNSLDARLCPRTSDISGLACRDDVDDEADD